MCFVNTAYLQNRAQPTGSGKSVTAGCYNGASNKDESQCLMDSYLYSITSYMSTRPSLTEIFSPAAWRKKRLAKEFGPDGVLPTFMRELAARAIANGLDPEAAKRQNGGEGVVTTMDGRVALGFYANDSVYAGVSAPKWRGNNSHSYSAQIDPDGSLRELSHTRRFPGYTPSLASEEDRITLGDDGHANVSRSTTQALATDSETISGAAADKLALRVVRGALRELRLGQGTAQTPLELMAAVAID